MATTSRISRSQAASEVGSKDFLNSTYLEGRLRASACSSVTGITDRHVGQSQPASGHPLLRSRSERQVVASPEKNEEVGSRAPTGSPYLRGVGAAGVTLIGAFRQRLQIAGPDLQAVARHPQGLESDVVERAEPKRG